MLDIIWDKIKQILTSRLLPISLIFIGLIAVLISRIFTLQIVEGEAHSEDLSVRETKTREIKSTRGNIYDRNGVLLAYNKISYSVVLEGNTGLSSNADLNDMLYHLINILEKYGNNIENDFGIFINEDGDLEFNVSGDSQERFKRDAYGLSSVNKLTDEQKEATASEVFDFLRHGNKQYAMFNIDDHYSLEDALKIMTLRFAMFTNYPNYNQIIISTNVSDETVAAIYENSASLSGVEIKQQSYRAYNDSIYNAHIIGYTGLANEDDLETIPESSGYNTSDYIGKLGIEKEFESYLAGTKGIETISVNSSNKYLETLTRTDPVAGEDIYLTIDTNYQEAYYKIIERKLAGILLSKIVNSTDAGTRGVSAKDIKIPIYDVYFALINNNVIDIESFTNDDSTNLEKQVYDKFVVKRDKVLSDLNTLLNINSTTVKTSETEQMQDYQNYIYQKLKSNGVLLSKQIDTTDSTYTDYWNDKISLSKFLQYALANNWIDLSKLKIGEEYYSTDELYSKLLTYINDLLMDDRDFHKLIYKDLVYSYNLTGTEICLLLFDQGVIKYNEEDITKLENGSKSAYSFIREKINNIEITPAQLALDPCSASVVVTDVKTGDVLAMVTYPSYDNNYFANKIDYTYYQKVSNDLSQPTISRATKQRTAPGSTFKMLTSIAALGEGVLSPTETVYDKTIFEKIPNGPKDWTSISHGNVDVTDALQVSCNYFFYEMGWRLGLDSEGNYKPQLGLEKLAKYASILGLDRKSGVEIEEADPELSDQDSVRSAIGQGTNNFTPIQLARYLTTVTTSGTCYDLTLVDKIVDKDGKTVLDNKAKKEQVEGVKDSTWELVHEGMYKVANGSKSSVSYVFKDFPYTVAGKTGTAQESVKRGNHALFLSYAPYEDPEISVAVVIPNGYSSSNAAELAKYIYGYYFNVDGYDKFVDGKALTPETDSIVFTD